MILWSIWGLGQGQGLIQGAHSFLQTLPKQLLILSCDYYKGSQNIFQTRASFKLLLKSRVLGTVHSHGQSRKDQKKMKNHCLHIPGEDTTARQVRTGWWRWKTLILLPLCLTGLHPSQGWKEKENPLKLCPLGPFFAAQRTGGRWEAARAGRCRPWAHGGRCDPRLRLRARLRLPLLLSLLRARQRRSSPQARLYRRGKGHRVLFMGAYIHKIDAAS